MVDASPLVNCAGDLTGDFLSLVPTLVDAAAPTSVVAAVASEGLTAVAASEALRAVVASEVLMEQEGCSDAHFRCPPADGHDA